jgi:hypothetical protein
MYQCFWGFDEILWYILFLGKNCKQYHRFTLPSRQKLQEFLTPLSKNRRKNLEKVPQSLDLSRF